MYDRIIVPIDEDATDVLDRARPLARESGVWNVETGAWLPNPEPGNRNPKSGMSELESGI